MASDDNESYHSETEFYYPEAEEKENIEEHIEEHIQLCF